ncbi:MAG: ATP-dependent DNA ligase [Spirochaetaceae bacterium]|nr:ATP-dependent DNA ligase [Spirochaetaceae bacterium]
MPSEGDALAALAVPAPVRPMLAKAMHALPDGHDWIFEPKWDGFRTLVFRSGAELLLQSRDLKPMNRYFPELLEPLAAHLPQRCVLDGEIVVATDSGLDFEALQQRIHPAASRVAMLAERTPAAFVAFDLLVADGDDLSAAGFAERREALERVMAGCAPPLHLTPMTRDRAAAQDWFERFEGAGLDGVIAKDPAGRYEPGKRSMVKVKPKRTVDCVVAGLRWHKNGPGTMVGSLLLGLYDDQGKLHHVGVAASFRESYRRELVEELAPLRDGIDGHPWHGWIEAAGAAEGRPARVPAGRRPGGMSRWSQGKDQSWVPLRAERVVEVTYDHMQGSRFRHTAHLVRWRSDKDPRDCTYDQLAVTPPVELSTIFRL